MKRVVLKVLFWRENSKAGALFGVSLAVFVLAILRPAMYMALIWMSSGPRINPYYSDGTEISTTIQFCFWGMFYVSHVFGCYALVLWGCFVWDIARKLRKTGLKIPNGMKPRVLQGAGCMAAGLLLTVLVWFWIVEAWEMSMLFATVSFLSCAGWVFGLYLLPWHKRVGRWIFMPLVLLALTQWVPHAIIPFQNKPLERAFTELAQAAGVALPLIETTWNDIYTNREENSQNEYLRKTLSSLSEKTLVKWQSEVINEEAVMAWFAELCVREIAVLVDCYKEGKKSSIYDFYQTRSSETRFMLYMAPIVFVLEKENFRKTILSLAALFSRERLFPQELNVFGQSLLRMGPPLGYPNAWLGGWMCLGFSDIAYEALHRMEHQRLLTTAITVERYRRATGTLPECLTELVPDYLEEVPFSQLDEEPFLYNCGENGFSITGSKHYLRRHFSLAWGYRQTEVIVELTKQRETN